VHADRQTQKQWGGVFIWMVDLWTWLLSLFWLWSGPHSWLRHMWPLYCGKYQKLPKSVSRNRIWHLAIAVRACLDDLTKLSMIVTPSSADRHHWSRSAALPSVVQYEKLPEWVTVLAVWHQCGRTGDEGDGGREELAALWLPWLTRMREGTKASNNWRVMQCTTLTQSALLL